MDPLYTVHENFITSAIDDPLPSYFINDRLKMCVPSYLNKKEKEKRIKSVIDAYENYVNTVCKDKGEDVYSSRMCNLKFEMKKMV